MKGDVLIRCPECQKGINLSLQIREFKDTVDERLIPSFFLLNIWCNNCEDMVMRMEVYETPIEEEIKSPAFKQKIIIKKPKE